MDVLLKPENLNLDFIFGKVLLTLNDSFCLSERMKNGQVIYSVHPTFWTFLGFDHQSQPKSWMDLIVETRGTSFQSQVEEFYTSDESAKVVYASVLNANKEKIQFLIQVVRLGEIENGKQSFLFMLKDISSRTRERELLKEGQKIVRMGYWELDLRNEELGWSSMTKELFGVSKKYIPGLNSIFDFCIHEESRIKAKDALEKCIQFGEPIFFEAEIERADGSRCTLETRGKADFEKDQCVRVYGTVQDITDRKRIENELRVSEESFRGAFENAAIGMAIISPEGRWLRVNKSICEITGYTQAELKKLTFADITHPEDLQIDLKHLDQLVKGDIQSYQIEKRYFHKAGHIVWVVLAVSIVRKPDGSPLHFVSQISDITLRKIATLELQNANRRIQGILDASTEIAIISIDLNGLITEFNKGAENMLGYRAKELLNKKTPLTFHDPMEVDLRIRELSAETGQEIKGLDVFTYYPRLGKNQTKTWTYIHKDGSSFPVQLIVTSIRDTKNEIIGYLGLATDLTEQKKSEALLQQMAILQSKSQEMEQFAYITSHDLKEPLLTITNYITLMQNEFVGEMNPEAQRFFNYINNAATHLTKLINGLLAYSRLSSIPERIEIDLNEVLHQVEDNIIATLEETHTVIKFESLPVVVGYPEHLYLLFQNLIQNAIKFRKKEVSPIIHISAKTKGDRLEIRVSDNGIGIPPRFQNKIFTIFQKLHDRTEYEGTGLGLALVSKICELHNSTIRVESDGETGTTFVFDLLLKQD